MIDINREIEAVQREVGSGQLAAGKGHVVRLRRTYEASIEDVWDGVTNPERISRWFLPVGGDFRVGGRYQLEGNAGGEILACEAPHRFRVTWVYGAEPGPGEASILEVRLTTAGDESTTLELEHTAIVPAEFWDQFGPGAVGVGWDGGMLGLALHLRGGSVEDPVAWQLGPEGRAFNTLSSQAWGAANKAAGVDPAVVETMVANTTQFYAPDPDEAGAPAVSH
jgi:uncharacterized protein YndB with AHSA1/START domain